MDISIIIPIFNGEQWIDRCFNSILKQELNNLKVEVCICNDGSTDKTSHILHEWERTFRKNNFSFTLTAHVTGKGCGAAKNSAIAISSGRYLCFQDVDDVMLPRRLTEQFYIAEGLSTDYIVGSKFVREPENATIRYTNWANNINSDKLNIQIYTSHGPTIIMPTWFLHRSVYNKIGSFSEKGKGEPEDLIFFYKHLDLDGKLYRINKVLICYTYHVNATTYSIHEDTIWSIRVQRLQEKVLKDWKWFTIWNAGKQGRKFYHSLCEENQEKVISMCDVDKLKIGKRFTPFDPIHRRNKRPIQIIHYSKATPPIVICVKMVLCKSTLSTFVIRTGYAKRKNVRSYYEMIKQKGEEKKKKRNCKF